MEGTGDSLSIKEGEDVVGFKVRAPLIQKQVNIGRVWSGRFGSHRQRLKDGLDWTSPQLIRMRRGEADMEKELMVYCVQGSPVLTVTFLY